MSFIEKRLRNTSRQGLVILLFLIITLSLGGGGLLIGFWLGSNSRNKTDTGQIKIGIVDSGCDTSQSTQVKVYEAFTNRTYFYSPSDNYTYDFLNHGSFVCEIIIQETSNQLIYSAKVASLFGQITFAGLYGAIKWLVEIVGVDIVNLSLGALPTQSPRLVDVFRNYTEHYGTIFVFSTGNDANTQLSSIGKGQWPALLPWTVGVGASKSNPFIFASYSDWGRTLYGSYVADFTADGYFALSYNNAKEGTSFAVPRVTAMLANLMQAFKTRGLAITPSTIQTFAVLMSTGYSTHHFDQRLGWGTPVFPDKVTLDNIISIYKHRDTQFIYGTNETERITRFLGENFTISWKVTQNLLADSIQSLPDISGNGSVMSQLRYKDSGNWGKILQMRVEIPKNTTLGNYTNTIRMPGGSHLDYTYVVNGSYTKKVLIDNSLSVNGYNHQFGQLLFLNMKLRSDNILPEFTFTKSNLSKYSDVVLLEPYSADFTKEEGFFMNATANDAQRYFDFLKAGGKLVTLLGEENQLPKEFLRPLLEPLGLNASYNLPSITDNKIVIVNTFANFDFSKGTRGVYGNGVALNITNSTMVTPFATYLDSYTDLAGIHSRKIVFGGNGTFGLGTFYVYSGYVGLTNPRIDPAQGDSYKLFLKIILK